MESFTPLKIYRLDGSPGIRVYTRLYESNINFSKWKKYQDAVEGTRHPPVPPASLPSILFGLMEGVRMGAEGLRKSRKM